MFWFLTGKNEVRRLKAEVQDSFGSVKKDFNKVGEWLDHLDGKREHHENEIADLKNILSDIQNDLNEVKDFISFFGPQLSKQKQTGANKQTNTDGVQTAVQTAVQTGVLSNLTVMERAIVWALMNSELKLSYEDLSALLGKNKSTIRGQINAIKQKNEGLILEAKEANGKKRLYIPDNVRGIIIKNVKVRVSSDKNSKKIVKKGE